MVTLAVFLLRVGRQHALALAARGAKVLVNDLGGSVNGSGGSTGAAQAVVDEIVAAGGQALANGASVTDPVAVQAMVQQALDAWGRVDVLVNNAGIPVMGPVAELSLSDLAPLAPRTRLSRPGTNEAANFVQRWLTWGIPQRSASSMIDSLACFFVPINRIR